MKKILVTGANKGVGFGIVKKLLENFDDTYVLLGSRNVLRGNYAIEHLVKELGSKPHKIDTESHNKKITNFLCRRRCKE